MKRAILAAAVAAAALGAAAGYGAPVAIRYLSAESAGAVIAEAGLVGTWSDDCRNAVDVISGEPTEFASSSTIAVQPDGRAVFSSRSASNGAHLNRRLSIVAARRLMGVDIRVDLGEHGDTDRIVIEVIPGPRWRLIESEDVGAGIVFVKDGRYTDPEFAGRETPWMDRCVAAKAGAK